jgi:hypothetical protein
MLEFETVLQRDPSDWAEPVLRMPFFRGARGASSWSSALPAEARKQLRRMVVLVYSVLLSGRSLVNIWSSPCGVAQE